MTTDGTREETWTGTPQGGILSPLPANIALTALDEHFARQWQQEMSTWRQRNRRRTRGQGNWRLIRFADDFVLMVSGDRHHAEELREEVDATRMGELLPARSIQGGLRRYRCLHLGRLMGWIRRKYAGKARLCMVEFRRRFCDRGWRIAHHRVAFTGASSVSVKRYRYCGGNMATPWAPDPAAAGS